MPPLPDPRSDTLMAELDARFRAPLMSYFARRVFNRAEAEDLTQEVFLRVINRPDVTSISNADAFLFRTAVNLLRDRARRERTRTSYTEDARHIGDEAAVPSPERVLEGRQTLRTVMDALAELGERTRNIFLLNRLEHMKYRDIADQQGLSVSAVEKHMVKALALLADRIDD